MKDRKPGRTFAPPSENDLNFQSNALMEEPPKTLKEAIGEKHAAKSMVAAYTDANPYFSREYSEYSENCQRCVVAYELRRRGYDVIAQATFDTDKWPSGVDINGRHMGFWRGAFQGAKTDFIGVRGDNARAEKKVLDNIAAQMKEYGNGSRAIIRIGYRGSRLGHVFNIENRNGRMYYVDAQSGDRYSNADMRNMMKIVKTESVSLTRTDNLRISSRAKEFVWQRNRQR